MSSLISIKDVPEAWRRFVIPCLTLPYLRYDDERTIFSHYRRRLAEIAVFNHSLKEAGWCTGGQDSYYTSEDPLSMHPAVWFGLLTSLTEDELEEGILVSGALQKRNLFVTLIRGMLAIRDGREFQPLPGFRSDYYVDEFWESIHRFVAFLMTEECGAPYLQLIPDNRLIDRTMKMRPHFSYSLTKFDNVRAVQKVLSNADDFPDADILSDWLELQYGFTSLGHPRDRLEAMHSETFSALIMEAVVLMAENRNEPALDCMKAALKAQIKPGRVFTGPFENFLFGLVLWRLRSSDAVVKMMLSLLKLKKIESVECWPLCLILKAAVQDDATAFAREICASEYLYTKLAGLIGLCIEALKLNVKLPPQWAAACAKCRNMPWFAFEQDALSDRSNPQVQAMSEKLGMQPLLPTVEVKPEWQKQLEYLITIQSADEKKASGTKSGKTDKEVLACLVEPNSYEVTLALRKTKDDERFSKGKPVSVASLVRGRIPAASDQDKALIGLVKDDWNDNYAKVKILKGPEVIRALIGHPYVFSAVTDRRLTVKRIALQIDVRTQKDGSFRLESNVPTEQIREDRPFFIISDEDTLGVVEPTQAQRKLLQTFTDRGGRSSYPAEASDLLKTLLEKLSVNTTVMSDLLRDSDKLEHLKGDPRTVFRIEPVEDGFDITALVRPVAGLAVTAKPGRGQHTLAMNVKGQPVQIERDTLREAEHFALLEQKLSELEGCRIDEFSWAADTEDCLKLLAVVRDEPDIAAVEWPEGEAFRVSRKQIDLTAMRLSSRRMGEWFEMEGEVRLDKDTVISVAKLLELLKTAEGGFIRLSDKEFIELSNALKSRLTALSEAAGKKPGRSKADTVNVSVFRADVFDAVEDENFRIDADEASRALLARLAEAKHFEPKVPKGLKAELRDYQVEGFSWMSRLAAWGAGSVLADDMGLGKTVQTIALLLDRAKLGPQLVVMPTAVLVNWEHEIDRFAPGLNVRVFNREDRAELVKSLKAGDVVLTSYGVLASEIELLKDTAWQTAVLDEAHTVKNRATKTSKAVMMLQADCRVLLTGTPLQNRLSEIWNLFQFANLGLLGTYDDFVERFITPIETRHDRAVQRRLKRLVSPFILRRTKAEVLDELPEKTELTIRVTLSDEERALYESLRERASNSLESGEINSIQALTELTKLRQAACHPELVDPKLKLASSKTAAFLDLVEELQESGHRALVFSQFTSHLALVKRELDKRGIEYLYLDGSDTAAKRSKLVGEFQQGDMPLFLISLKAGGTGLNLTAADYVIHLDPWWNPAIEDQASDRAYRIGQDRPVTIYRLIAAGTIEEKILRLHEKKKSLADALLEGADMSSRLSKDEILKLLAND